MPTSYLGINAPTISNTPGAGAPGTIVNVSPLGTFSLPYLISGNDPLSSAFLGIAIQSNRDAINWCALHIVDWANGGNYSAWTGGVMLGSPVTWSGLATFTAGVEATGNSFDPIGVDATGFGSSPGIRVTGGSTSSAAIVVHSGPVQIDTSTLTSNAAPGVSTIWANSIVTANGVLAVTSGTVTVLSGFNIASATILIGTITITFATAPTGNRYTVIATNDGGGLILVGSKGTNSFTLTPAAVGNVNFVVIGL